MVFLLDSDKHLKITKQDVIYKFETGVNSIKVLLPQTIDNVNVSESNCIILLTIDTENGSRGLFKYVKYNEETYKNRLVVEVPITTTLTKDEGEVKVWILLLGDYNDETKVANAIIQTDSVDFKIKDNGSKYSQSTEMFDEIWQQASVEKLQKEVDELADKVQEINKGKADNIEVDEENNIVLRSGDDVLARVKLADDVAWEEWN